MHPVYHAKITVSTKNFPRSEGRKCGVKGLVQWRGLMVWSRSWFRTTRPRHFKNFFACSGAFGENSPKVIYFSYILRPPLEGRALHSQECFLPPRGGFNLRCTRERYIPKNVFFLREEVAEIRSDLAARLRLIPSFILPRALSRGFLRSITRGFPA